MISRRDFLSLGALAGLAAFYPSFAEDSTELRLEEITLPIRELPKSFESFRIGLLSDLHLGSFVRHESVEHAIVRLNDARPDIVLLAGDYISVRDSLRTRRYGLSPNVYFDHCPPPLLARRQLSSVADLLENCIAPEGTLAVFGNHDRHVSRFLRRRTFEERGIGVLENESYRIVRGSDSLNIIGVEDFRYGLPRLPRMSRKKERQEARIILSHNPDFLSAVIGRGGFEFDLGLAGHTHGGQVKLPLLGALQYNINDKRFAEGLVLSESAAVYTTRGVGMVGLPLRLNCPPEATVITLQRA